MNDTMDCPRCRHEHFPDEPFESGEHECEECGFRFVVTVTLEPVFTAKCVVHSFGDGNAGRRFCEHCLEFEARAEPGD